MNDIWLCHPRTPASSTKHESSLWKEYFFWSWRLTELAPSCWCLSPLVCNSIGQNVSTWNIWENLSISDRLEKLLFFSRDKNWNVGNIWKLLYIDSCHTAVWRRYRLNDAKLFVPSLYRMGIIFQRVSSILNWSRSL